MTFHWSLVLMLTGLLLTGIVTPGVPAFPSTNTVTILTAILVSTWFVPTLVFREDIGALANSITKRLP